LVTRFQTLLDDRLEALVSVSVDARSTYSGDSLSRLTSVLAGQNDLKRLAFDSYSVPLPNFCRALASNFAPNSLETLKLLSLASHDAFSEADAGNLEQLAMIPTKTLQFSGWGIPRHVTELAALRRGLDTQEEGERPMLFWNHFVDVQMDTHAFISGMRTHDILHSIMLRFFDNPEWVRATASLLQLTQLQKLEVGIGFCPDAISQADMASCSDALKTNGTLKYLHLAVDDNEAHAPLFDGSNAILRGLIGNSSIEELCLTNHGGQPRGFWKGLVAVPEGPDALPLLSRMKGVQRLYINEDGSLTTAYINALESNYTLQRLVFIPSSEDNGDNRVNPDDRRRIDLLLLRNRHLRSSRNFVKSERKLPAIVETLIPLQIQSDMAFPGTYEVVRHALARHFNQDWRSSFQSGPDGVPVELGPNHPISACDALSTGPETKKQKLT
jgi:hypothetical protein